MNNNLEKIKDKDADIINIGKTVVKKELEALEDIYSNIDKNFIEAVKLITNIKTVLAIAGIGKSGLIGAKIVSSMTSLGIPSLFLHLGEASHGDLGILSKLELVIIISNSGNSYELIDVIEYCKFNNIKIIAITKNIDSILGRAANILLKLPDRKEASEFGAPTVSTTATLAIGDALAITVSKLLLFSEKQFLQYHPGGSLGKKAIKIKSIMRRKDTDRLPLVEKDEKMDKAIMIMTQCCLGCLIVMKDNKYLIGIITDGDLRRHLIDGFFNLTVADIMSESPITIDENNSLIDAIELMNKKKITNLCVLNKEKILVGMLHLHDCLKITNYKE